MVFYWVIADKPYFWACGKDYADKAEFIKFMQNILPNAVLVV